MGFKRNGGGALIGEIKPFAGATIPAGWLPCAGQAVSRVTYAALFLAIGTTWGAGDGSTTFNLPDARGRALFGKDDMNGSAANRLTNANSGVQGATLGASGGGETVTLTATEMPTHTHIQNAHTHQETVAGSTAPAAATYNNGIGGGSYQGFAQAAGSSATPAAVNTQASTPTNQNNGSSGAHRNIPPAIVINYIIKA
jgi:microcystin-dependent protein